MRDLLSTVIACVLTLGLPLIAAASEPERPAQPPAADRAYAKDTLPPLAITIGEQEVRVTGGHPNGRILIVGYERAGGKYKLTYRRHRAFLDADATGALSLTPRGGIAPESTWVGVDVQSGRYGVVTLGTSRFDQRALARSALKNATNGPVKEFVMGVPMAYFIVVRPGEGAWELSAGDGGGHDRDHGIDGKTEMSLDDFLPVDDDLPPPTHVRKDDLLLVFSPGQQTFFALRLADGTEDENQ